MGFIAESRHNHFWFGTEQRMQWFPTPLRGADVSPHGWESEGTYLNGGGFQLGSFGSHRRFVFEWSGASSRKVAQTMRSYSDGTFGRGLIYFIDPLTWDTNLFPAMWADPSIGIGNEGASLVYGVNPTALPTSSPSVNDLPVSSAYYNLATIPAGWRGREDAVFIPIPEGMTLSLGAIYSSTGTGGVFYRTQTPSGGLGTATKLPPIGTTSSSILNTSIAGSSSVSGVWIYVGRSSTANSSVTLTALTTRLRLAGLPLSAISSGPWIGGQGHSGCRFAAKPTYIDNTGVSGGQIGFAASFTEVGSWIYG